MLDVDVRMYFCFIHSHSIFRIVFVIWSFRTDVMANECHTLLYIIKSWCFAFWNPPSKNMPIMLTGMGNSRPSASGHWDKLPDPHVTPIRNQWWGIKRGERAGSTQFNWDP